MAVIRRDSSVGVNVDVKLTPTRRDSSVGVNVDAVGVPQRRDSSVGVMVDAIWPTVVKTVGPPGHGGGGGAHTIHAQGGTVAHSRLTVHATEKETAQGSIQAPHSTIHVVSGTALGGIAAVRAPVSVISVHATETETAIGTEIAHSWMAALATETETARGAEIAPVSTILVAGTVATGALAGVVAFVAPPSAISGVGSIQAAAGHGKINRNLPAWALARLRPPRPILTGVVDVVAPAARLRGRVRLTIGGTGQVLVGRARIDGAATQAIKGKMTDEQEALLLLGLSDLDEALLGLVA